MNYFKRVSNVTFSEKLKRGCETRSFHDKFRKRGGAQLLKKSIGYFHAQNDLFLHYELTSLECASNIRGARMTPFCPRLHWVLRQAAGRLKSTAYLHLSLLFHQYGTRSVPNRVHSLQSREGEWEGSPHSAVCVLTDLLDCLTCISVVTSSSSPTLLPPTNSGLPLARSIGQYQSRFVVFGKLQTRSTRLKTEFFQKRV